MNKYLDIGLLFVLPLQILFRVVFQFKPRTGQHIRKISHTSLSQQRKNEE